MPMGEGPRQAVRAVLRWAEGLGMVFDPDFVFRVTLVDRPQRPGHLGLTVVRPRRRSRPLTVVHIVRGLSDTHFRGVVAHELAHVWSALRRWRLHPWAQEGFGELLAYHFYMGLGIPEALALARRIETNPDPLYGGGFRRMRALLPGIDELRRFIRR